MFHKPTKPRVRSLALDTKSVLALHRASAKESKSELGAFLQSRMSPFDRGVLSTLTKIAIDAQRRPAADNVMPVAGVASNDIADLVERVRALSDDERREFISMLSGGEVDYDNPDEIDEPPMGSERESINGTAELRDEPVKLAGDAAILSAAVRTAAARIIPGDSYGEQPKTKIRYASAKEREAFEAKFGKGAAVL